MPAEEENDEHLPRARSDKSTSIATTDSPRFQRLAKDCAGFKQDKRTREQFFTEHSFALPSAAGDNA
jgi:hypothetical protein